MIVYLTFQNIWILRGEQNHQIKTLEASYLRSTYSNCTEKSMCGRSCNKKVKKKTKHHLHHTYIWIVLSYASDLSRLRQSTLCLHLSSDAGYHWNAQYQGLQSQKTTELQHKDEVGESLATAARNDKLLYRLLKKRMGPKRKDCWESRRVRGMQTDKGLPVCNMQYSKLLCVCVCV